ncbi:reverse transcriptase domain-containing protein [Tanacetum coccineum]
MVTSEGIRANPKKTKATADMQSPRTLKKMQSLSGKLATLKRFLSRSAKKSLPFFETLKDITKENKEEYRWTENAKKAFKDIKNSGNGGRECDVVDRKKGKAMSDTLCQVLADFLSEAPVGTPAEEFFQLPVGVQNKDDVEKWTHFTDGASNSKGSRAGLVLISPSGVEFTYALRLTFTSTNNEAEYEALLAGLRMARKMKVKDIDVKVDSKLVASQINESYMASSTSMIKYSPRQKNA